MSSLGLRLIIEFSWMWGGNRRMIIGKEGGWTGVAVRSQEDERDKKEEEK